MRKVKKRKNRPIWDKIEPFINLSVEAKLNWLEEARKFVDAFVPLNKRLSSDQRLRRG